MSSTDSAPVQRRVVSVWPRLTGAMICGVLIAFLLIAFLADGGRAEAQTSTTTTLATTSGGSAVTTVAAGSVVTLTASVYAGASSVSPAQVAFCDAAATSCAGSHLLGIAQVTAAGTAIYRFVPGLGAHSYRAMFLGTASYAASASAPTALTVTGTVATTTTIAQSGTAPNITLTGTTVGAPYPAANPTQTVTINLGQSAQNYVLTGTGPSTVNGGTYGNYYNTQGSCVTAGATTTCDLTGSFTSTTQGYASGTYDFQTVFTGNITTSITSQTVYPVDSQEPNPFTYSSFAPSLSMTLKLNVTGGGAYTIPVAESGNFDPNLDYVNFADVSPVCSGLPQGVACQEDNVGTVAGATYTGAVTGAVEFEMATPPTLVGPTGTISFLDTSNANAVLGTGTLGAATAGFGLTQATGSPVTVGKNPYAVATGDFNGDGLMDVVVGNYTAGTLSVLLGKGDGTFQPQVTYAVGTKPERVLVADLNQDGNLDLVVANTGSNTVGVLLGKGDGTFQAQVTYACASPVGLGVMDINHDGIPDVVAGDYYANTMSVLLGTGTGTLKAAVTYATGRTPQTVAEGDFNGDGNIDVAVGNESGATVGIFLGKGDGTFQTMVTYPVGSGPQGVQVGDFNGDGKLDLAVSNHDDRDVGVLLGNGDGTFQTQVTYLVGSQPVGIEVADLNGDGILDITVGSTGNQTQDVLLGKGDGTFAPEVTFPAGNFPYGVAVADFNGDGVPDLTVTNYTDGTATIFLSKPTETAVAMATGIAPATGTHEVVASYPGDANFATSVSQPTAVVVGSGMTTSVITWAMPAAITTATPLSATQLDATAATASGTAIPGTFVYTPAAGATLAAGTQTLSVTFTPTDTTDFTTATKTVSIVVTQASGAPKFVSNVGTALAAQAVAVTFAGGGTLSSIQVLTQGVTGLDFTAASGGSCAAGTAYTAGQTCTVNVAFDPQHAGTRPGAVLLLDGNKNTIGITYLQGSGTGPQIIFGTGTQSVLGGGLSSPQGLGLDGSGNVYVADQANGAVKEIPAGCTAANCVTTLASGFMYPNGLSVDGAGNLFFDDFTNSNNSGSSSSDNLVEEIPFECASASCFRSLGSGFDRLAGIAVDVSGNVFVSDWGNNAVKELLAVNGVIPQTPTINVLAGGFTGQTGPDGLTLDASGNVFVTDHDDGHALYEIPAAGGYSTLKTISSSFTAPEDVAFDGTGNAFVVDEDTNSLYELPAVGGSLPAPPTINTLASNFNSPEGVAVDALGNVYVSDYGNQRVVKIDYSDAPSVSFATATTVGSTDTTDGPQKITIQNNGNAALTFTGITASTNFKIDSGTTTCSTTVALAAGSSCVVSVDFAPTAAGALTGTVTLTDNTLNAAGATQAIALSGTGVAATAPVTSVIAWATPAAIAYGTALGAQQLNATAATAAGVAIPGTFVYTPAAGTVLTAGMHTLSVMFTPTSTNYSAATGTATITVTKAAPVITWANPAAIAAGTALSATQLDAAAAGVGGAALPGTFVYTPPAGTLLTAGSYTLSVAFTPNDAVDYSAATATVPLTVSATGCPVPGLTPSSMNISYYTLAETDQDEGHFPGGVSSNYVLPALGKNGLPVYNPAATASSGSIVAPQDLLADNEITWWSPALNNGGPNGTSDLVATGTGVVSLPYSNSTFYPPNGVGPDDLNGYQTAVLTGTLTTPVAETVSFSIASDDLAVMYLDGQIACDDGGAHGATAVPCTTATVAAGTHTLQLFYIDLYPTGATLDFSVTTSNVVLSSSQLALGTITLSPAATEPRGTSQAITIGIPVTYSGPVPTGAVSFALNGVSYAATCSTAGQPTGQEMCTAVIPAATIAALPAAAYPVSGSFAGDCNYPVATAVPAALTITAAGTAQTITFGPLAATTYGAAPIALVATASSGLPVSYAVTGPATVSGSTLTITGAGAVTVTASQAGNAIYAAAAPVSQSFAVGKATPVITWAAPAGIAYGTALSATQLDATVAGVGTGVLAGTLVYTPTAGTVLTPGTHTLSAAFAPTDTVDYTAAAASVNIVVGGLGLSGIAPLGAVLGSANTTITLTGTGFVPTSVVLAGTKRLATTYVGPTMLTAVVPATLLGATGTLAITVSDPSIEAVSAAQTFTVVQAVTAATLTGPSTTAPGTQPTVGLTITNPYPLALTAQFTLTFAGAASPPVDDPSIQFSSGGRMYSYTVAANSTSVPPVQLQAGTDAGTITITAALMADGVDVTPAGLVPLVIVVPPVVPVISGTTITASGKTLTVVVHGFSNTREVSQAVFDFTAATGDTVATPMLTIPATTIFSTWFSDATSDAYGSTFTYTQIFNTSGDASTVGKVKVTLTNSIGVSAASTSP